MPFGVMLGVTIAGDGTGRLAGLFGAAFVFGGSAQLTAVTLLSLGATVLAALASAVVVNARILLYGAALEPVFRGQPLWFRLAAPLFIQDQTYLSAPARPEVRGAPFRHYWAWLSGLLLFAWTGAVGLGLVAGPYLPDLPHLGLVSVALFVAMLVPRLLTASAIAAALAGGATAVAVAQIAPQVGIIAGAVAGVVAGLLVEGLLVEGRSAAKAAQGVTV